MIKRIASKLFGKKQTQLPLENEVSEVFDEEALEEYFHRLPGFPQGIPVIPVEILIRKNEEMIKPHAKNRALHIGAPSSCTRLNQNVNFAQSLKFWSVDSRAADLFRKAGVPTSSRFVSSTLTLL